MSLFRQDVLPLSSIIVGYLFTVTFGAILPGVTAFLQDRIDSYLIFGFMAVFVVCFSSNLFWLLLKAPRMIELGKQQLFITTAFDNRIEIPLVNVVSVQGFFGSKHAVMIRYKNNEKESYFFLHIDMLKSVETGRLAVGLLIESLLENTPNLRRLDVDSFINLKFHGDSGWAKPPEWRIINQVKARVELNLRI